jgi:hypothetical protein
MNIFKELSHYYTGTREKKERLKIKYRENNLSQKKLFYFQDIFLKFSQKKIFLASWRFSYF